jgi:hypothetical protein
LFPGILKEENVLHDFVAKFEFSSIWNIIYSMLLLNIVVLLKKMK